MNYLHAYHAGNFADCFKHALLMLLVEALGRKPGPFFVLDTHAGAGRYDLEGDAAQRTKEADAGIRRLLASRPVALERFLTVVSRAGLYPGSPALILQLMRPYDRLACCELHEDVIRQLRSFFGRDPRVHIHRRSGWEAIGALLPPAERRGLVFVDPPFEDAGEFGALVDAIVKSHTRFSHGVFAGWYPIKRQVMVRTLYSDVVALGIRDIVAVELCIRDVPDVGHFSGCGLIVVNPPYRFEDQAVIVANAILDGLGPRENGARVDVIRLSNE